MNIPFVEDEKILIIIPVLWIIGKVLKSTPRIKNWMIPWILSILSLAIMIFWKGIELYSILQAIILCGIAVYGNQLVKQSKEMINYVQSKK